MQQIPDMDLAWETKRGGFYIAAAKCPKSGFILWKNGKILKDLRGIIKLVI